MFPMKNVMINFFMDEGAATAIEYGLIACFISMVCVAVWTQIGANLVISMTPVNTALR